MGEKRPSPLGVFSVFRLACDRLCAFATLESEHGILLKSALTSGQTTGDFSCHHASCGALSSELGSDQEQSQWAEIIYFYL
jgi:hypothetical protein